MAPPPSSSSSSSSRPHILVFPYPAQGHMLPLLDLTHQLALKDFTITIVITHKNLPILTPLLSAHPSAVIQPLLLPFPPHPSLPPGVNNVKDIGNRGNLPIISALRNLHGPILDWFNSHPSPPLALISDFFLGFTLSLTRLLGIPRITFFSSGAFLTSVSDYCWKNEKPVRSSPEFEFSDLPRSPQFKEEHLPSIFRIYNESDPALKMLKDDMLANTSSWGCVFNSFHALEGDYLDYLKAKTGNARIFGVGPLSMIGLSTVHGRGDSNPELTSDLLTWLDGCPEGSVLYVCFGSQKLLKREQMQGLAFGLEKSGSRFIWVVKPGTDRQTEDGYGIVPEGFEERVAGRGVLIKGWAPQVEILGHRAVGGFLSHCGWNSVLESVASGVMILGWPMEADQFVNARLLVEYMGVAVRVCEGADSVPNSVDLGKLIAESMRGDSVEKGKAKELREKAVVSVRDGWSSMKDLDELVSELRKLKVS